MADSRSRTISCCVKRFGGPESSCAPTEARQPSALDATSALQACTRLACGCFQLALQREVVLFHFLDGGTLATDDRLRFLAIRLPVVLRGAWRVSAQGHGAAVSDAAAGHSPRECDTCAATLRAALRRPLAPACGDVSDCMPTTSRPKPRRAACRACSHEPQPQLARTLVHAGGPARPRRLRRAGGGGGASLACGAP